MKLKAFLEQVLFVVVLYREQFKDTEAWKSLQPLCERYPGSVAIYIYDNSPEADHQIELVNNYNHDATNSGVSKAYNRAAAFAKENGYRFLLLMDQDSFFPESIFSSYSQAVEMHKNVHVFAPQAGDGGKKYSPFTLSNGRGNAFKRIVAGIYDLSKIKVINSGLLVSVEAFLTCGGYDERFPLDFSDIVFSERLSANHYAVYIIDGVIHHRHSSSDPKKQAANRERFQQYLQAVLLYQQVGSSDVVYWRSALPTAFRLSAAMRDSWYLRKFFRLAI